MYLIYTKYIRNRTKHLGHSIVQTKKWLISLSETMIIFLNNLFKVNNILLMYNDYWWTSDVWWLSMDLGLVRMDAFEKEALAALWRIYEGIIKTYIVTLVIFILFSAYVGGPMQYTKAAFALTYQITYVIPNRSVIVPAN